jgi:aspartyl-tRNA(Asn)/glutamyl-tRNA(Gln) amidotransferase subunit B
MYSNGGTPEVIAQDKGLLQVSDVEPLRKVVQEVLASNPVVVAEYKGGKESVLQFLVGATMKATKGAGNPAVLREILLTELSV